MNLLQTPNALNLRGFLEHFELTLLSILHPRYNSIPAENRMGDTLSLKITYEALYIQYLDRSRTTAMDGGSAGFAYVHGWTVVGQRRSSCRGAVHRSIQLIYLGLCGSLTNIRVKWVMLEKEVFK